MILSGQATFLGYVRLDDTSTWLAFIDQFFAHGRALSSLPTSTYSLLLSTDLTQGGYPPGAFMLPGIGHALTGIDVAWIFQPYMAVCAGALALCVLGAARAGDLRAAGCARSWRSSPRSRRCSSATPPGAGSRSSPAAFLLALGLAATARLLAAPRPGWRDGVPLAVAGAALIDTLGAAPRSSSGRSCSPRRDAVPGAPVTASRSWVASWRRAGSAPRRCASVATAGCWRVIPLTAALLLPAWLTLSAYLHNNSVFTPRPTRRPPTATSHGRCGRSSSSGIWLYGDFRSLPVAAVVAPAQPPPDLGCLRRRRCSRSAGRCGSARAASRSTSASRSSRSRRSRWSGTAPWIMGKSLAISSPAVLLAGMAGGAILFGSRHVAAALAGILCWARSPAACCGRTSCSTATSRSRRAPGSRSCARSAGSSPGHGPTFFNEYEIYGDRHFLRAGAPVEPAEYRPVNLPTLGNALLTSPRGRTSTPSA